MKQPTTAQEARSLIATGRAWLAANGRSEHETLGDPRMKAEMDELKAAIKSDPEVGAKLMRDAGIWDENNQLTEKFAGGAPTVDEMHGGKK
jgi:hypothetical protein